MTMSILCLAGHHSTRPSNIANQGYYFSSCTRCGRQMIGSAVKWKPVPRVLRVVWRPAARGRPSFCTRILNLPMVVPQPFAAPRRRLPRLRFADLVLADFKLLAWVGTGGLKLWHSNFVARLFELRPRSNEWPVIRLG
jgi:hypothetical protein